MQRLSEREQRAFDLLPNDSARIAVARWLELCRPETHSYWRWRPSKHGFSSSKGSTYIDLIKSITANLRERTYDLVPFTALDLLAQGGPRAWQYSAVSTFLLDRDARFTGQTFQDRLREFSVTSVTPPVSTGMAWINWTVSSNLSFGAKLPIDERASVQLDPTWPQVRVRGPLSSTGDRTIQLSIQVPDTPRSLNRGAVDLRTYGSQVLDLIRTAIPDVRFNPSDDMTTTSTLVRNLRATNLPRSSRHEIRPVARQLLTTVSSHSISDSDRAAISALRWMSTANTHWPESPATAAAMLWPAIEVLFGKCVYKHVHSCKDNSHPLPVDTYIGKRLPLALVADVDMYLKQLWGSRKHRTSGSVCPPPWLSGKLLNHGGRHAPRLKTPSTACAWLREVGFSMRPYISRDPLLAHRVSAIADLLAGRKRIDRASYVADLADLYGARNQLVHEGGSLLDEARSEYLAALAMDFLVAELQSRAPTM